MGNSKDRERQETRISRSLFPLIPDSQAPEVLLDLLGSTHWGKGFGQPCKFLKVT